MDDTKGQWGGYHPLSFSKPPTFTHLHREIVTKNILWKWNEMNDAGKPRTYARVTLSVRPSVRLFSSSELVLCSVRSLCLPAAAPSPMTHTRLPSKPAAAAASSLHFSSDKIKCANIIRIIRRGKNVCRSFIKTHGRI